ncbi:hypothetical protein AMECASPLE_009908 [Ameca splendens]|uniref:Uncharacterized protein n=1 Tax=Ameca splendens TaxID=208324 RepID=A0ABV0ZW96_9TELE
MPLFCVQHHESPRGETLRTCKPLSLQDSSYQDFKDAQKTLKSGTEIGEAAKRLSSKCFAPPPMRDSPATCKR